MKIPVLLHLVISSVCLFDCTGARVVPGYDDDEARLLNDILRNYDKKLRPVLHKNHTVRVVFGLTLNQIIDMIERYEILKLSLYIRQIWRNPLLAWNTTEYGGIRQVNLEPNELWKPDIYLYNNADSSVDGSLYGFKAKIKVQSNGVNIWLAPTIMTSSCKINVKYFPFDEQACYLKFGSWTYDAGSVDIVTQAPAASLSGYQLNGEWDLISFPCACYLKFGSWTYDAGSVDIVTQAPAASLSGYQLNGEWDLISFPCVRNAMKYVCCPHPFTDVTCTLHIRRRTLYYWVNLILPCMLITVLSLLSFIVTTESGERISLVITNLLALTVFMLIVADILPPTSEVVPLISVFITSSIVQVGLSLVATCLVLNCYHTNPNITEMPFWMRHYVCGKLGPFLRITHSGFRKAKEEAIKIVKRPSTNSTAQLKNLFLGYNTRPSELRGDGIIVNGTESANSCRLCQAEFAKELETTASRPSSIFAPHILYKENFPDSVNVYRGRADYYGDQYHGRNEYAEQYRGRNEDADQFSGRNVYADHYRRRSDFVRRNESYSDQPYRGHKDSFPGQGLVGSTDEVNAPSKPSGCTKDQEYIPVLNAIIHRQDHLVEGIQQLTDAVDDKDTSSAAREEWVFAAHVIDRFFLYLFLLVLASSIIVTFAMIPKYQ